MEQREISATVPANEEKGTTQLDATISVNYPETIEEAVQMFGEDAILSNAFANWRVTLQANIRSKLKSGMSPDDIQNALKDAKMGVAIAGQKVDAQTAFIAKFKSATPEKQAEMLALLRSAAQG